MAKQLSNNDECKLIPLSVDDIKCFGDLILDRDGFCNAMRNKYNISYKRANEMYAFFINIKELLDIFPNRKEFCDHLNQYCLSYGVSIKLYRYLSNNNNINNNRIITTQSKPVNGGDIKECVDVNIDLKEITRRKFIKIELLISGYIRSCSPVIVKNISLEFMMNLIDQNVKGLYLFNSPFVMEWVKTMKPNKSEFIKEVCSWIPTSKHVAGAVYDRFCVTSSYIFISSNSSIRCGRGEEKINTLQQQIRSQQETMERLKECLLRETYANRYGIYYEEDAKHDIDDKWLDDIIDDVLKQYVVISNITKKRNIYIDRMKL